MSCTVGSFAIHTRPYSQPHKTHGVHTASPPQGTRGAYSHPHKTHEVHTARPTRHTGCIQRPPRYTQLAKQDAQGPYRQPHKTHGVHTASPPKAHGVHTATLTRHTGCIQQGPQDTRGAYSHPRTGPYSHPHKTNSILVLVLVRIRNGVCLARPTQ